MSSSDSSSPEPSLYWKRQSNQNSPNEQNEKWLKKFSRHPGQGHFYTVPGQMTLTFALHFLTLINPVQKLFGLYTYDTQMDTMSPETDEESASISAENYTPTSPPPTTLQKTYASLLAICRSDGKVVLIDLTKLKYFIGKELLNFLNNPNHIFIVLSPLSGLIHLRPDLLSLNTICMTEIIQNISKYKLLPYIFRKLSCNAKNLAIDYFEFEERFLNRLQQTNNNNYTAIISCVIFDIYSLIEFYHDQLIHEGNKICAHLSLPKKLIWINTETEQKPCNCQPMILRRKTLLPTPIQNCNIGFGRNCNTGFGRNFDGTPIVQLQNYPKNESID